MNRAKPIKEQEEENLPFSFSKKDVDAEKIKEHWQKIKNRIELDRADSKDNNKDGNLL